MLFDRGEQGGVAECQPRGGATQELLLVLFFFFYRQRTPTQPALSHSEKQFGLLSNQTAQSVIFRVIAAVCLDALLQLAAPV